jgi:hypothetical protein
MGQRIHNTKYWREYVAQALSIADQMTDPVCKTLLTCSANTFLQPAAVRSIPRDEPSRLSAPLLS